ncbi:MAG TPA: M20/M25/M40 family metallo-hydrolase [Hyphomonadaceae bacterium]|nr:M20/M25/M40 family metallo-hydrolase [Hyphomonadaceae bacterium]
MRKLILGVAGLALLAGQAFAEPPTADKAKAEAREIYAKLVGLDTSVEGKKVPEMANWLADRFKAGGFAAADVQFIPMGDTGVLVARYRGSNSGQKPILFIGHMDVVPAHRADWTRDPFKLVEENGYFFGRGSIDNKSGVTSLAATFLRLKREGFTPKRDMILVFSGDEETSGVTTKKMLAEHRALIDGEFALNSDAGAGSLDEKTGQATSYSLQTAEKTFASFTLTAHNPGGHSSQPRKDNAIYDVVDALTKIRAYAFPVQWNDTTIASLKAGGATDKTALGKAMAAFAAKPGDAAAAKALSDSPFTIGQIRTTCVPTLLQAGHADNALPQSATATVNCRIFPGVKIADVQAQLQKLAGKKIEIKPLDDYVSSDASPLRPDVMAAVRAAVDSIHPGIPVTPGMSAGATDGVFYRGAGIPTYGVGEVFIKDSDDFMHGLNERNSVKSFEDGLVYWDTLVRKIAG